jgi:hypothetical protein
VKGVLAKLKGRLVIVVLSVLIVVMLPTAWFVSGKLNAKIREQQTKAYQDEAAKIKRANRVTYTLPRISEAESSDALSDSRAPNDRVTNWFKAQRAEREQQINEITSRVVSFNRDSHGRLIEAFPPAADADARTTRRSALELARAITGDGRGYDRSAYEILFEQMGAGKAPDRDEVSQSIAEFEERELDRLRNLAGEDGNLSDDQEQELSDSLVERRIGEYRRVAREISFYGSPAAVTGEQQEQFSRSFRPSPRAFDSYGSSEIPVVVPEERPTLAQGYIWQWDYWVIEDILRAIARANTDAAGDPTPVDLSVVKRVESIRIDKFTIPDVDSEPADAMGFGGGGGMMGSTSDDAAGPERTTITGRKSGDGAYDLRRATVVVIVSPARLIEFLDAIKATNLMTVTDLDLEEIDVWADLADGYFYSDDEYVMRATIQIESVWLRDWAKEFMPGPVRKALGIADEPVEINDEG